MAVIKNNRSNQSKYGTIPRETTLTVFNLISALKQQPFLNSLHTLENSVHQDQPASDEAGF